MMSRTFKATRESRTWAALKNFRLSEVTPKDAKHCSTRENHNAGSAELNNGRQIATRLMERAVSSVLTSTFSRSATVLLAMAIFMIDCFEIVEEKDFQ